MVAVVTVLELLGEDGGENAAAAATADGCAWLMAVVDGSGVVSLLFSKDFALLLIAFEL